MTYKMFIDDERFPVEEDWLIVRTSYDAQMSVEAVGVPSFISFDHDLGGDDTSMVFIKWLIDYMLDNDLQFPKNFDFYVHSQNPIGKANIEHLMNGLIEAVGKEST